MKAAETWQKTWQKDSDSSWLASCGHTPCPKISCPPCFKHA